MESDWGGLLFVLGLMTLATIVLIVVVWQLFSTYRARCDAAREQNLRKLAQSVVDNQDSTNRRLEEMTSQLAEIQAQLSRLDHLLREVE